MNDNDRIAVTSRSFSANTQLRSELLSRYSKVTFNDQGLKLEGDELVRFLSGSDKAITALERIDNDVLSRLPELKVISKYGVGIDMIDLDAMRQHGKRLGWIGGVNRRSVSELVIAFSVLMLRHVLSANLEVRKGVWRQHVGSYLSGKVFGIIGCGHIGKDLVRLLQPFDCKILVNDIRVYSDFYAQYNIQALPIEDLLSQADVVSLHVPLDDTTINLMNGDRLSLMKTSSILINTSRGNIVDECFLRESLIGKRIAAAAFDVFAQEPPTDNHLLHLSNFLATPHIGGSAYEAILAMGRAAIDGLDLNEIP